MREAMLIAWREYRQYIFSRGFLLLLLVAPVGLVVIASLFQIASDTRPVRNFVIVEEGTDDYTAKIDAYFDRQHQSRIVDAWLLYAQFAVATPIDGKVDPAFDPGSTFANRRARADQFFANGGVVAANRALAPYLRDNAQPFTPPTRNFRRIDPPAPVAGGSIDAITTALRPYLNGQTATINGDGEGEGAGNSIFAALILPAGYGPKNPAVTAQYWSRNHVDTELRDALSYALTRALQQEVARDAGLGPEDFAEVVRTRANIEDYRSDRSVNDAALSMGDRVESSLPALMTYVLFILIFSVGSLLLTNTIEERSNKIVETLLSSVTANQLMIGKLVGIGAVGLTIPAVGVILTVVAAFTVFADNEIVREVVSALVFSPLVWVYLFYFVCGYVIFAMIYLAIGAISNSLQDAQTFIGPVTLVVMLPFPLMAFVFQDPNGLIASIMTWIPIYTPYAVMLRAASDPPLWEIIGATILMLVFGAFFVTVMGRIFRRGLLNDSPPTLGGLLKLAGREKS